MYEVEPTSRFKKDLRTIAGSGHVSVMESKLRDQKRIVLDAIDDTVFSGNPARPKTGRSMLQGDSVSTGLSIC